MKLAASSFVVALAVFALAAPGALAKPTPANLPNLPSAGASAVEMEQYYNDQLAGLSPLQRSELRISNRAPVAVQTQAAVSAGSNEPFDWTAFGILVVLATGTLAISGLAYARSRRVGRVAHS
jgi:hypothetical protein